MVDLCACRLNTLSDDLSGCESSTTNRTRVPSSNCVRTRFTGHFYVSFTRLGASANSSSESKKCPQAFLVPLPGIEIKTLFLVAMLRNANKHFWRRCRGRLEFIKHLAS